MIALGLFMCMDRKFNLTVAEHLIQFHLGLDHYSISSLLEILDSSTLCFDNEDMKFVDMIAKRKEKNVVLSDGRVVA